jgi:hypothetical protein
VRGTSPVSGYFFAAAFFAAHIFLVAAMMAALPAALSLRFGFGAAFEAEAAVGVTDAWGLESAFFCGPPFALGVCHGFASGCADLPPGTLGRYRRGNGLGRFPRKKRAEFGYLSINTAFLLFEANNGGSNHFSCEFWSRHVVALRLLTF